MISHYKQNQDFENTIRFKHSLAIQIMCNLTENAAFIDNLNFELPLHKLENNKLQNIISLLVRLLGGTSHV